jgi:hypothetical protein
MTTFPVDAPEGTDTVIALAVQQVGQTLAEIPLKLTVDVPWLAPKFAPAIVTVDPIGPAEGVRPVIAGPVPTTNCTRLLEMPSTVTDSVPVTAPVGTFNTMLVALHDVGTTAAPPRTTVLVP